MGAFACVRARVRACACVRKVRQAPVRARVVFVCAEGRSHPVRVRGRAAQARAVQAQFFRGPAPGLGSLPWGRLLRDSSQHAETSLEAMGYALQHFASTS